MPCATITSLAFDLTDDRDRQDYILILMRRKNITIQNIADQIGVVRTHISTVIAGQRKSRRIRAEIARLLDFDEEILWKGPPMP